MIKEQEAGEKTANVCCRQIQKVVTPALKRKTVAHLMEQHQVNQRRRVMYCKLTGHRCDICRDVAMMLSRAIPQTNVLDNGTGAPQLPLTLNI